MASSSIGARLFVVLIGASLLGGCVYRGYNGYGWGGSRVDHPHYEHEHDRDYNQR